jgi:hypothetical protein
MPDKLFVYGPIITSNGPTRVIKYTVKIGTEAALEYTAKTSEGFGESFAINAPRQSVAALILQYGTQAAGSNGFSPGGLFANEITTLSPESSGGTYALKDDDIAIIPLDTEEIKKQLRIVLAASQPVPDVTGLPIIWIEDNQNGIGTVEKIDVWGAGTYAGGGIRIGGLSAGGSITAGASTVDNFDAGDAAKNQPRSLATVLSAGQTSTINFYNPNNATGLIGSAGVEELSGSLSKSNGSEVKKWATDGNAPKPAVSVIYKWAE